MSRKMWWAVACGLMAVSIVLVSCAPTEVVKTVEVEVPVEVEVEVPVEVEVEVPVEVVVTATPEPEEPAPRTS